MWKSGCGIVVCMGVWLWCCSRWESGLDVVVGRGECGYDVIVCESMVGML